MSVDKKEPAILAVDIGNTSTAVALLRGCAVMDLLKMPTKKTTKPKVLSLLAGLNLGKNQLDGAIVSSVVPSLNTLWLNSLKSVKPLLLTHKLESGFKARYPSMNTLGADRIANISAAIMKYGAPAVVVDIGTAVTFDVLNKKGEFIGGVIAPGPRLFFDYMNEKTAKLPEIERDFFEKRIGVIGKNTKDAMKAAFVYGYPAMLEGILLRIEQQLKKPLFKVIVTGGFAKEDFFPDRKIYYDKFLIFEGLYRIWLLNAHSCC
jgi:type III pantothenate kinase